MTCSNCTFDDGTITLPIAAASIGIEALNGPSGAVHGRGTISYRDSQPATTFDVSRVLSGVRRHGHCVRRGHGRRCTLLVPLGSFTHGDVAGSNRVGLPSRLGGHRLVAGSYQLSAVPRNAAGAGRARRVRFGVH